LPLGTLQLPQFVSLVGQTIQWQIAMETMPPSKVKMTADLAGVIHSKSPSSGGHNLGTTRRPRYLVKILIEPSRKPGSSFCSFQ
jgi:hypothetical protein